MATQIGITVYCISLLLAEQWSIYCIYDLSIFMRILKSRTPQAEEWATACKSMQEKKKVPWYKCLVMLLSTNMESHIW